MPATRLPGTPWVGPKRPVTCWTGLVALGAALVVLASGLATPLVVSAASAPAAAGSFNPTRAHQTVTLPTVIRHVIIVMEENHDLNWTLTDPTFSSVYTGNAHATAAFATCHPSAPNYIAATSATKLQCGSDGVSYYNDTNLASDLVAHSLKWQGLMESMPSACDRSDSYPYIAHHNPWVYYSDLQKTCASNDLALFTSNGSSRLQNEISGGTLPALTFVTPNMLHDAHDGTLSAASSWLTKYVLKPVNGSKAYASTTAVFVVFDEAYKKSCSCSETGGYGSGGVTVSGGPIYLVTVSPIPPLVLSVTGNVTFFNLVSTVEWLLGVPTLSHDDNSHFPALTKLFS